MYRRQKKTRVLGQLGAKETQGLRWDDVNMINIHLLNVNFFLTYEYNCEIGDAGKKTKLLKI